MENLDVPSYHVSYQGCFAEILILDVPFCFSFPSFWTWNAFCLSSSLFSYLLVAISLVWNELCEQSQHEQVEKHLSSRAFWEKLI